MFRSTIVLTLPLLLALCTAIAQEARLRPAEEVRFPCDSDGNSPSFWWDGSLHLFTSIAWPLKLSSAPNQFGEWRTHEVKTRDLAERAIWVEAAWVDEDGTIFAWYHHEPWGMWEDSLMTAPKIGALVSDDHGRSTHNMGIILESGDPLDETAKNGFFAGGHGDFSVVLDRERKYFYFLFTNYGGPVESQGICVARLAFADRFEPDGKVFKYYKGSWNEPGLGGRVTPIFPARRGWEHSNPDSFWGPAVHWNTHLGCFVMLLNRAKGEPGWSQEGIYVSFAKDLSKPGDWLTPAKILDNTEIPSWSTFYPQVMGLDEGDTDTQAGRVARFYLHGTSRWEIEFTHSQPADPDDGE